MKLKLATATALAALAVVAALPAPATAHPVPYVGIGLVTYPAGHIAIGTGSTITVTVFDVLGLVGGTFCIDLPGALTCENREAFCGSITVTYYPGWTNDVDVHVILDGGFLAGNPTVCGFLAPGFAGTVNHAP